ncbi:P-loop NTPase fold protein [Streptomyces sp. NBC_01546]|uniref:P-loop NTPase fold protein n=1 Tax=Streptomyces sp. NBC_01546 TaxID=2975872 RepID=UPI00386CF1ED
MSGYQYLYRGELWMWDTGREQAVYEQAVNDCLRDSRVGRRLGRRPGVTEEAVRQAMWRAANVHRALEPCEATHLELREAMLRLSEARHGPFAALTAWRPFSFWRLWAMFFSLTFLVGALTGDRALLALAIAAVFGLLAVVPVPGAFSGGRTAEPELWAGPLLRPVLVATARRAERAWARDLVEAGVGPLTLRVVDALLGEDPDGLLLTESHAGLRASYDPGFLVPGRAAEQLRHRMDQFDGGTIAVCGPRGVGKTTLLRDAADTAEFSVMVSAPATYAPHDFLLSLFTELCRRHLAAEGHPAPDFVRLSATRRLLRRVGPYVRRLLRLLAVGIPAAALVVLGMAATVHSLAERPAPLLRGTYDTAVELAGSWIPRIWRGEELGAALVVTCAGLLVWRLRREAWAATLLRTCGAGLLALTVLALKVGPFVSLALDAQVQGHLVAALGFSPLTAFLVLLLLASCAAALGAFEPTVHLGTLQPSRREVVWAAVYPAVQSLLLAGLAAALLTSDEVRAALTDPGNPARLAALLAGVLLGRLIRWRPAPTEPKLVRDCRDQLYRLQTVQTSSSGLTSGATQLLTLGGTHTTALSTVPPKFPELVADFRELLVDIAQERHDREQRVVIAIDEVDRLGSDAKAREFLAEIKAILGVPHVHYLISVAEDVGAAFVRRGLPHRDVTDSSIDDIVHIQPCTLDESREILRKRAPGISDPYVLLAHALSGGLPRDLIRYGRRIIQAESAAGSVELHDISREMILEELSETLAGFRTLLSKQQWTPQTGVVLTSFRTLTGRLRSVGATPRQPGDLVSALADFALRAPQEPLGLADFALRAPHEALGLAEDARQLIDEASAYAYFSLTLLDIFAEEGYGRRRERAEAQGADGDPELLAEARRELAVSPYSTRPLLSAIRTAWGLSTGTA